MNHRLTLMLLWLTYAALNCSADTISPKMRVMSVADTRFGLFGEKPASPAPTLFVFALGVEGMDQNRGRADHRRRD